MSWVSVVCLIGSMGLISCSGHHQRPPGPAPEYERPQVMPWDAGAPVDPLDNVKGEEVTDDEPAPSGSDAGAADAGAKSDSGP